MKKLFVLMMALALVAFALPALAQLPNINATVNVANDVNDNDVAVGNTSGSGNNNLNQFNGALIGDQSTGTLNKSAIVASNVLSGNNVTVDTSTDASTAAINKSPIAVVNSLSGNTIATDNSTGAVNKSQIGVSNSLNGNTIAAAGGTNIAADLSLDKSLNGNEVYVGAMTNAWRNTHQYEHQFDHQLNFGNTFANTADATIYMPISNIHMEQANTGISTGNGAGAAAFGIAQINLTNAEVNGMVGFNANMGGVGTNQAALNVVTAFNATQ